MVRIISLLAGALAVVTATANAQDATAPVCDTTVMITLLTKATATMPDQTTAGQITEACFGLIGQDVSQLTDEQICSCFGPLPASAVTPEMDSLQCLGTPTSPMTIYETWVQCGSGTGTPIGSAHASPGAADGASPASPADTVAPANTTGEATT